MADQQQEQQGTVDRARQVREQAAGKVSGRKGVSLSRALSAGSVEAVILLGGNFYLSKTEKLADGSAAVGGARVMLGVDVEDPERREFGMQVHEVRLAGSAAEIQEQARIIREGIFPGWFGAVKTVKKEYNEMRVSLRLVDFRGPLILQMMRSDGSVVG